MNQFCEKKSILRQFSVARTPQKNGVAERRNRTLIEAARTMLADSKLPTTFWAEAVNTACYANLDGKAVKGIKASDNAGQARQEKEPVKDYILLPLWTADPPFSQDPKSSHDDGSKPSNDDGKKVDEDPRKDINAIGEKPSIELPDDPNMPTLEDYSIFDFTRNDEDYGVVADMKIWIQQSKSVLFQLQEIEAMQEELLQFKLQEVWTLVDLPNGKSPIGTKWVFRNKKDERGIVIRNKARLVAQGYTQEEGIEYDEVFAHVARIEAIRQFLAYASFKDFVVYQMDVKSAFIYGR
ncbi:retrovirus-related pol polyprotein from transposon TNT 1-94 [Tanacetum coccineum]